jgi:tRNA threonylcarbamoyladenosine biosynthesis protein TsaE
MEITFTNSTQTMNFAKKLADCLEPGDVLVLNGDLGAGKTTFTKGLAEGLWIDALIKSPTFTIIREYQGGRLPLYHMDVYRLENGGGEELGLDEYFDGPGVSVVEWAQFVEDELPHDYLSVNFRRTDIETERRVTFVPHGYHFKKIIEDLNNGN